MAHFAEIDDNNTVVRVLVVKDEFENDGQNYLANVLNLGGTWIQTSYNNNIRKQFAAIGYKYDSVADVFIQPQPYASWSLDNNFDWQAPISKPVEGRWYWDEATLAWVEND